MPIPAFDSVAVYNRRILDAVTAGVLASGMANSRGVVTYDEPVDMSAYDEVFAGVGGGGDA